MSEFVESFADIPLKCHGCGVQCELSSDLATLLFFKGLAETTGGRLVGEAGERFDAFIEGRYPEEVADQAKKSARQFVGASIEGLDDKIKTQRETMAALELSCNGIFRFRATKDDITYTVGICTSPRVYVRDGDPVQLPTLIRAQSASRLKTS